MKGKMSTSPWLRRDCYLLVFSPPGSAASGLIREMEEEVLHAGLNAAFIRLVAAAVCVRVCEGKEGPGGAGGGLYSELTPLTSFVERELERQ